MTRFFCSSAAAAAAGTMIPIWKITASVNVTLAWSSLQNPRRRGESSKRLRVYGLGLQEV